MHIMKQVTSQKREALIISLDAENASDSVRWRHLYKVSKFGLHSSIIDTVAVLYERPTVRIRINGDLTDLIYLQKGKRQGCCASPLIFALFIESLSQWIRQTVDLEGVITDSGEQKLALHADDLLISLTKPTQTLLKLMKMLYDYGLLSRYKINIDKTQVSTDI